MSQRNIELQVGISKVTEVTRIQQQMQQHQMQQQADFEQAMHKQVEHELARPGGPDENRATANQDAPSGSPHRRQQNKRSKKTSGDQEPAHPYKGKNIDIKG